MSLLEKAIRGTISKDERKRGGLFSRAVAAQAASPSKGRPSKMPFIPRSRAFRNFR